jgi:hypothetical protein
MTIRDHRLKGAAQRWGAAQLRATPRRRIDQQTKAITKRVKRSTTNTDKKDTP